MRVLLQRVSHARVSVGGERVSEIGPGLLLFVGIAPLDGESELAWMASKCARLRVFSDEAGKMNRSVLDVAGDVLAVPQFTLYADTRRGHRPSFVGAASPEAAEAGFERFVALLEAATGRPAGRGRFGAHMEVELLNDGPVTLWMEREPTSQNDERARAFQA